MTNANLLYGSLIKAQRASRIRRREDDLADRGERGRPRSGGARRPAAVTAADV